MGILTPYEKFKVKFEINSVHGNFTCTSGWHRNKERLEHAINAIESEGYEITKVVAKKGSHYSATTRKFDLEELREPVL